MRTSPRPARGRSFLPRDTTDIFGPDANLANFAVTYYQGGLQFPLADPRRGGIVPFIVATAGVANLDPDIPGTSAANRSECCILGVTSIGDFLTSA